MKMYIPSLGDVIMLKRSWTFTLYKERRNWLGVSWDNKQSVKATLKAGTMLKVERIYIRAGARAFSSVTFRIRNQANSKFWVKLNEVNGMVFELCESADSAIANLDAEWAKAHPNGLWAVRLRTRKWDQTVGGMVRVAPFFDLACYTPVRPSESTRGRARTVYANGGTHKHATAKQFKPGAGLQQAAVSVFNSATEAEAFLQQYMLPDEASVIMAKLAS